MLWTVDIYPTYIPSSECEKIIPVRATESRLRGEVTKLQTAARCTALVQFGLKEQVSTLQSRLKEQSNELDAAYNAVEQQEAEVSPHPKDCDDPQLAAELAVELAELMNELEATQKERDDARVELTTSQAGNLEFPVPCCAA
eukprot:COSAG02_NODE_8949_length_2387_cov_1.855332_3_plen_142_part_00